MYCYAYIVHSAACFKGRQNLMTSSLAQSLVAVPVLSFVASATPKDGPSAGCAFTSAFISRILNRMIKNDIAMTGEIDLTGKVSKIGGLEFKLQGAKKANVSTVFVPKENEKDIIEIKEKYKNLFDNNFTVILVSDINEIIDNILL